MKQSTQNYLKTIFSLSNGVTQTQVKVSDISKRLEISPAAVTEMIKKLDQKGFVKNEPYKGVFLTKKGLKIGCNMVRHHRLWETYLNKVLGVPWDKVHDEAERLEHACSDYLINRIEEQLHFPEFDPHGNPIPDRQGVMPDMDNYIPLIESQPGVECKILRVVDLGEAYLQHLDALGISLNCTISLVEVLDFDDSVVCKLNGKNTMLSKKAASHIFVKR